MSKYIGALREKGRELFNSYLALKKHLEVLLLDKLFCIFIQLKKNSLPFTYYLCCVQELRYTIDRLERENNQKKEIINQVYVYKFFREINSKKCLKQFFPWNWCSWYNCDAMGSLTRHLVRFIYLYLFLAFLNRYFLTILHTYLVLVSSNDIPGGSGYSPNCPSI